MTDHERGDAMNMDNDVLSFIHNEGRIRERNEAEIVDLQSQLAAAKVDGEKPNPTIPPLGKTVDPCRACGGAMEPIRWYCGKCSTHRAIEVQETKAESSPPPAEGDAVFKSVCMELYTMPEIELWKQGAPYDIPKAVRGKIKTLNTRVAELEELNQVERQSNANAAGRELALQGELDELRRQFDKKMNVIRSRQGTIEIREKTIADLRKELATAVQEIAERNHTQHFTDGLLAKVRKERDKAFVELGDISCVLDGCGLLCDGMRIDQAEDAVNKLTTAQAELDEAEARVVRGAELFDGLTADFNEAQADTARLDWLCGMDHIQSYTLESGFYGYRFDDFGPFNGDTLRESIDAVMTWQRIEAATAETGTVSKTETVDEDIALLKAHAQAKASNATNDDAGEKVSPTIAERIEALMSHYRQSICIVRGEYSFYLDPVFHKSLEAAVRSMEAIKAKEGSE